MSNILKAIYNVVNNPVIHLIEYQQSHNRVNNMGEALEEYIKDIFAETVGETNPKIRLNKIQNTFSYLGNQNNPPDCIIRNGDAIEVKKIESKYSGLALNSSYPKAKLFANSKMITKACKSCEIWDVKDIIYTIGVVKNNNLSLLFMVYGVDYAASEEIYERIKSAISSGILTIPDVEFSETNELGRVNRVDPLGITYLRIRGMWHIENPLKAFNYVLNSELSSSFNLISIINNDKYNCFDLKDIEKLEKINSENVNFNIEAIQIKSPDNPSKLVDAKLESVHTN